MASKFPFMRKRIAIWDDKAGNGLINPIKKWWWDLEWVDGKTVEPLKGTNRREIDLDGGRIADCGSYEDLVNRNLGFRRLAAIGEG